MPTAGLTALYDFVQGANSQVLYDQSGNGNNAVLGATTGVESIDPIWTTQGLLFDGVDDKATGPVLSPHAGQGMTFMVVFAATKPGISSVMDNKVSGTTNRGMNIEITGSDLRSRLGNGSSQIIPSSNLGRTLADGLPRCVWSVADTTLGRLRVYLGAEAVAEASFSPTWTIDSTTPLVLGNYGNGAAFGGSIYYAAAYNRPLSETEINFGYRFLKKSLRQRGVNLL